MSPAAPAESFWAMGGYAAYVWPAYAIAIAVIAGLAFQTIRDWRQAQTRLRALECDSGANDPKA